MVFTRRNLDWWCERGILSLVLGMLVFAPLAFGAVDVWAWLTLQVAAAAVLILWIARLWLEEKPRLLWPPTCWAVLAFMVYAVARYFTADVEYVARWELLQVLLFGFLFFAVLNNLHGQDETAAVSVALIAVGTVAAGYAVGQLLHHSNRVWNELSPYVGRASGTFISPNNLSCLLAMLLPLALAFLLVGKVRIVTRILLGYAVVAMGAGLAVTFSRGGYLAAAAGILLALGILLFHGNHRLKAALLLAALLAGGGFFTSHYLSKTVGYMRRVAAPGETAMAADVDASADTRFALWGAAVRMWADHPWFGVGPAHFDYRFREYRPPAIQGRPDRAHNDYLNLLADWGAVGGVIVFSGAGIFIVWLRRTWPQVRRPEIAFGDARGNRFAFFLGAVGGLTALAVHSLTDFNLHVPANALAGVTLLALLTGNVRHATERFWVRPGRVLKPVLSFALAAVAVVFVAQTVRLGGEALRLARARALPAFSPEQTAALEKAFAVEPENFETAYEIGECLRLQSLNGGDGFAAKAEQAMDWYARSRRLNPHDSSGYLRAGMCLDWLGRSTAAAPFYAAAEARDPNGYFTVANVGWHYVQIGDYATAREWVLRSLKLQWNDNPIAHNYLAICESRLAARAAGTVPPLPGY